MRSLTNQGQIDKNGFPLARPCCLKCIRPPSHCVCALIKPFEAHVNFLILQHPHERKKYYSTAKLVLGSISNSNMLRGVEFEREKLEKVFASSNHYLLYPGPDAVDCETLNLSQKDTVIILDGTWSEAGKLLHRNPILRTLPKISFSRELKSNYLIRKQPKDRCLSTIEAIAHLLKLNAQGQKLSSETLNFKNYNALFDIFSSMVQKQLAFFPRFKEERKCIDSLIS